MNMTGDVWTGSRPLLTDAISSVLSRLDAAGIRNTVDMKRINPPGTFLRPPVLAMRFRGGDFTAGHRLVVVVASKDRAQSYDDIAALMDSVMQALGDVSVTASPADVETSDQSTFLTAYELTWTERVRQQRKRDNDNA